MGVRGYNNTREPNVTNHCMYVFVAIIVKVDRIKDYWFLFFKKLYFSFIILIIYSCRNIICIIDCQHELFLGLLV
jgi:hypothetical protein